MARSSLTLCWVGLVERGYFPLVAELLVNVRSFQPCPCMRRLNVVSGYVEPSTMSLIALAMSTLSAGIAVTRFISESPLFKNHFRGLIEA